MQSDIEFELVCDKKKFLSISQSILMAGIMAGSLFMTQLADAFGRKPVLLGTLWFQGLCDIMIAFMPSYIPYVCFVFLIGICQSGYGVCAFVLGCEYLTVDMRMYGTVFGGLTWAFGMLFLDFLAYVIPSWRYLQISLAVFNFITILYYWFLPESLHWLITHGKEDQARDVVRLAAKTNGIENIPNLLSQQEMKPLTAIKVAASIAAEAEGNVSNLDGRFLVDQPSEESKQQHEKFTLLSILKHKVLRRQSLLLCFIWFTNSLVYYGLSFYVPSLSGDVYVNFAISACVEMLGYLIAIFVLRWFGRRKSLMGFHIVAAASLLIVMFIPIKTASGTDLSSVTTTLSMIGKFGISGSFMTLFLYGAEVYPTVVRNIGIGWNSFWARLGGILAPYANILHEVSVFLVPCIFGILALICAIIMLFMPETSRIPLPEVMGDVSNLTLRELVCGGGEIKEKEREAKCVD